MLFQAGRNQQLLGFFDKLINCFCKVFVLLFQPWILVQSFHVLIHFHVEKTRSAIRHFQVALSNYFIADLGMAVVEVLFKGGKVNAHLVHLLNEWT